MQTTPVLTVRDLRKSFTLHTIDGRKVTSLHGVDLDVAAGEHVALAGPSGAGKSSFLRCVHRSYLPDSGSVVLHTDDGPVELTDLPTGRWPASAAANSVTSPNSCRRRRAPHRSRWWHPPLVAAG